jgi:hypothetical protein
MPENDEMSLDVANRKILLSLNNPFRIIEVVSFVTLEGCLPKQGISDVLLNQTELCACNVGIYNDRF